MDVVGEGGGDVVVGGGGDVVEGGGGDVVEGGEGNVVVGKKYGILSLAKLLAMLRHVLVLHQLIVHWCLLVYQK